MPLITGVMQDYLKAIYHLQQDRSSVSTSDVAKRLGVSPASATNMIKRLAERRLLAYTRYHGFVLTPAGQRIALETIRHHRLLELYLARHLGVSLDQVDKEADRLEHALSDEVEARIAATLGDPVRDPHGDPIPSKNGTVRAVRYPNLTELPPGEVGVVDHVSDRLPEVLQRLVSLGILPDVTVRVLARLPGDRLRVSVGGKERAVPRDLAEAVHVR